MLRLLVKTAIFAVIALLALRLIPSDIRDGFLNKAKSVISPLIPESLKRKAEAFTMSPVERREKLIAQLKKNIAALEDSVTQSASPQSADEPQPEPVAAESLIEKTKKIIQELESANTDQSAVNKITSGATNAISTALGLSGAKKNSDSSTCPAQQ